MQDYRFDLTVDVHDLDFNGIAKASSLLRYLQSAAQSQLTEKGLSYDEMKKNGRVFVISRMKTEFSRAVRAYEKLTAVSFPCESKGYSFLRCYELLSDGEVVGRSASIWALLDVETKALIKVSDFDLRLPLHAPLDLEVGRIRLPAKMRKVGDYAVTYATVDQNRHMNNTHYPDVFAEYLPLEKRRIASISISYLNEAPAGDRLTVERGEENGLYYFRTTRSDGKINATAEIALADI